MHLFVTNIHNSIRNSIKKKLLLHKKIDITTNIADINSHSVHGNVGKYAVYTRFICEYMLQPITYLLKNTDITQRTICHAQQWGQRNPCGLMGRKSNTFNQVICIRVKEAKPVYKHQLNNAKEMQLQCVSKRVTSPSHQTIDIYICTYHTIFVDTKLSHFISKLLYETNLYCLCFYGIFITCSYSRYSI